MQALVRYKIICPMCHHPYAWFKDKNNKTTMIGCINGDCPELGIMYQRPTIELIRCNDK